MNVILNHFKQKENNLIKSTEQCNQLAKVLQTKIDHIEKSHSKCTEMNDLMTRRINYLNLISDEYESRINKLTYDDPTLVTNIATKV